MGAVRNKDGYWDYVSDNELRYELLEGKTIGSDVAYSSDICFILLDDMAGEVEINPDDRFVGYMYGATFLDSHTHGEEYFGYVKEIVDNWEKNHPDIVEKLSPKKMFRVNIKHIEYGTAYVEARTEKEAMMKVEEMTLADVTIWNDGIGDWDIISAELERR